MTNQQIDNKLPPETDKFKDEIIEIDLVAIFRKIISFRKTIYKAIGISLVIGIIIAISIPKQYTVRVTLSPEMGTPKGGGLSGLAASFLGSEVAMNDGIDALNASLSADIVSSTPFLLELLTMKLSILEDKKTILVTGAAGFIGSNLVKRIYQEDPSATVIGIDNMNAYYDVALKEFRLNELAKYPTFTFVKGNIADKTLITEMFEMYKPSVVVNLAAQAGVRYSITNPDAYVESNLVGFFNILEACRHCENLEHLVYASSSSVYGSNKKVPYSTDDKVDNPVSLYAATKKSNELMAHAYSKLYNIPSTGLRFFTVYGPVGRPDMAYFGFTNKLVNGETIKIFNYGNCKRDFTYVDDIVEGVVRVMRKAPDKKNGEDGLPIPPYAVYNIGNQNPENLLDFVQILSEELVRAKVLPEDYNFEAHKELVPMQPGDVPVTYADTSALERDFGYKPSTSLRTGLRKFAEWYAEFYK